MFQICVCWHFCVYIYKVYVYLYISSACVYAIGDECRLVLKMKAQRLATTPGRFNSLCCSLLQRFARFTLIVLQCIAVCCIVLQCVKFERCQCVASVLHVCCMYDFSGCCLMLATRMAF